jgi:hypothetical protein
MGKKIAWCTVLLLLFCAGSISAFARPQPDFTFYGTAYVNGTPLTQTDTGYTITLEADGIELVRYRMGDDPGYGDNYVLIVPMDDDPAVTTKGQEGDTAYVYINGVEVDESPLTLGDYGKTLPQDINATLITYTISGYVLTFVGTGIADVMMSGLPGNPTTSPDGSYVGTVHYGWIGVVSPMKSGYVFSPAYMSYIDVTSDHTGQNYTGSLVGNRPPVALAGPDQNVEEGVEVTLDGSASYDVDDGIYAYLWTQIGGPGVGLSDISSVMPIFTSPTIDQDGEALLFELRITDYEGQESSDICIVNVTSTNLPPVADAGPDQEVEEGDLVVLDGDNSYDPDGTISSYLWIQLTGTHVTLSDETIAQPTFTAGGGAPEGESLIFELFVTDDGNLQSSDICIVTILGQNAPPVADAGSNQVVDEGQQVWLNGSGSSDPDGDDITFLWKQVRGTVVHLSDVTEAIPTFTAPDVGPNGESLLFELIVTDEWELSSRDSCIVSVVTPQNAPPVANAGSDRKVKEGTKVDLNGGGSYDPDGAIAWCQWSQISGPPVTLEDVTEFGTRFTAPEVGPEGEVLVFQFTVCDGVLQDCDKVTIKVTDEEEGGGNGGPSCAVTAAAIGSPLMEKVDVLRQLRDRYLGKHMIGRAIVRLYYKYGPYVARYIEDHEVLRRSVRTGLYPIVGVSYVLIKTTVFQKMIIVILITACIFITTIISISKNRYLFENAG